MITIEDEPFYYVLMNKDGKIESGFHQKDLIINLRQLEALGYELISLYRKRSEQ